MAIDAASLYSEFEKVKDGRGKKGKRYPLSLILTLLMLGKMAGETTINGIVDWIKERKGTLKRQLNWPKRFPVNSTYSYALAHCDGQEVAKAIAHVIVKARASRGMWDRTQSITGIHMKLGRNWFIRQWMGKCYVGRLVMQKKGSRLCICCRSMSVKVALSLRKKRSRASKMRSQRQQRYYTRCWSKGGSSVPMRCIRKKTWCAGVDAYDGYYLLVAKKNQPGVRQDLLDFFEDKDLDQGEWDYHKTGPKRTWTTRSARNLDKHADERMV